MNKDIWNELRTICENYSEQEVMDTVEVMFNCKSIPLAGEIGYTVEIIRIEIANNKVKNVELMD